MKLTSRQELLLGRLVELGDTARACCFPLDVLEIIGFGSFFRGKRRPKDVDLLIRCSREHTKTFAAFAKIVHHICSDVAYQHRYKRPLSAFLNEFERRNADMLPGFSPSQAERSMYGEWLARYSWSMLFPRRMDEAPAWESPFGFMARIMRRRFPNLNVVYYIYPGSEPAQIGLRAGFTEVIWSRDQTNLKENVLQLLTPEWLTVNNLRELTHLDRQLFLLRSTSQMIEAHARSVLEGLPSTVSDNAIRTLATSDTLLTEAEIVSELGTSPEQQSYPCVTWQEIGQLVEERRHEVKRLWWRVETIRTIVRVVTWRSENGRDRRESLQELLADELLGRKPREQLAFIQGVLSEFRFGRVKPPGIK